LNILEARDITKTYVIGETGVPVIDKVSLGIPEGQFAVIQGRSGSGKTTLLTLLSGLDKPTSGTIFIKDKDITLLKEDALAPLRNEFFGFVFQSFHLVPSLTALENVMFPAELKNSSKNMKDALHRAESLLKRVDLTKRAGNYPHQLSGGEKQRVAICRALINNPRIIFADEPTGNLDSVSGEAILNLLTDIQEEYRATIVLVTHSIEVAGLADRIVTLEDGRVIEDRSPGTAEKKN
jgi:putative ABC transport system ATP-binding protein